MWGVYRFKEGLGAKVVQTTGALDYPVNQIKYKIIQEVLPKILAVTRRIRRRQIKNEVSD
jgi:lipid II:glycine glycyltransferase (peptidoglycan interpeptide bridge formation enzyme)